MPKDFDNWFDNRRGGVYGSYEHDWGLCYQLQEGDIYMEAGAFWGRYGRKASLMVGVDGRVYLIEPDPLNAKVARHSVDEQGLDNVVIIRRAVWEEKTKIEFSVRGNPAGHRVKKKIKDAIPIWRQKEPDAKDVIMAQADTVDNIVEEYNIPYISLFAADVENSEIPMLHGMHRCLEEHLVKNLAIAAYHRHPDGNFAEVIDILEGYGYKAHREPSVRSVVYACL